MHNLTTTCLLVFSMFSLTACRSADRREDIAPQVTVGALVEADGGLAADSSVELKLEQLIKKSRVEGGVRVVDFDLRNRSEEELTFAFMVEWLDRQGLRVPDRKARWTNLVLPAEASASLVITAPSPIAESWRLRATAAVPE